MSADNLTPLEKAAEDLASLRRMEELLDDDEKQRLKELSNLMDSESRTTQQTTELLEGVDSLEKRASDIIFRKRMAIADEKRKMIRDEEDRKYLASGPSSVEQFLEEMEINNDEVAQRTAIGLDTFQTVNLEPPTKFQKNIISVVQGNGHVVCLGPKASELAILFGSVNSILIDESQKMMIICESKGEVLASENMVRKLTNKVSVSSLFGGKNQANMEYQVKKKPDIVISTIGMIGTMLPHEPMQNFLSTASRCIIFQAGKVLYKLSDNVTSIIEKLPPKVQIVVSSLGMTTGIEEFGQKYMQDAKWIENKPKKDFKSVSVL